MARLTDILGSAYRQPVLDLIMAATRALNAYADTADKPVLNYTITTNGYNLDAGSVENFYSKRVGRR
jgi:hypothetical protein